MEGQEEGVPQGIVLSVTLFALSINGIASVIPPEILFTLFVDDLSLSFAASRMSVAERKLQLTIDKVVRWAAERGFKFSPSKTVVMHFCRIRGIHPDPDLYIYGQRISCVQETRFLGLLFDCKLTWEPHIKNLKKKCLKSVDVLKVLSCTKWGADRKHLLQLHHAIVVSKLSYGCEVYSSAKKSKLDSLNAVHNAGIRIATGAFKSSPIPSLMVDANELPLNLIRQSCMIKYWFRTQRLPKSMTYSVIFESNVTLFQNNAHYPRPFSVRIKEVLEELGVSRGQVLPVKYPAFPPWKLPSVEYCTDLVGIKKANSEPVIRQNFILHAQQHSNSVFIFTDGSKSNAGVGFGVVFPDFNLCGALPSSASIFTCELFSILVALKRILDYVGKDFTIFSDSRSALEALETFNPVHPLVLDILEWLFLLNCKQKYVNFCWVPSHVGVRGNEEADKLAKNGAMKFPIRRGLPYTDYLPGIKRAIKAAWQFCWTLEMSNKMREITDGIHPWVYMSNCRKKETSLCRLRIGHTRFSHGYLMSGDYQPFCDDCLVPLTVRHVLIECPSLMEMREHHLGKDSNGNFSLDFILGKEADEDGLFNFIEEAGFFNKI